MSEQFGKILNEYRLQKDMSLRDLAKLVDVSYSYINKLEKGQYSPSKSVVKALALALNAPVDNFLVAAGYLPEENHIPPGAWPAGPMVKVPILGTIRAGEPILAEDNIEGWELTSVDDVKDGDYFYLRVQGDSMIGSRIHDGDLVLVRKQEVVENGEIGVVNVDGENATLKRVYRTNGELILQPDNPKYAPAVIKSGNVRICGKVVQVRFVP